MLLAVVLCLFAVQSASSQTPTQRKREPAQQPSPQASPLPSPGASVIDTPQVAAASIQLNQQLRSLPERIVSNEALGQLEQQIDSLKARVEEKALKTELAIQSGANFTELQQSTLDWDAFNKEVVGLSETLTKHATALESEVRSFRSEESRWLATNEVAKTQESATPELLEVTGKAITDISGAIKTAEERRSRIVGLQQSAATQASIIATEIQHLNKAKEESQRSLLESDSLPLWKVQFSSHIDGSLARLMRGSYPEDVTRLKAFIRAKRTVLILIALVTIVAVALFIRLSRVAAGTAQLTDPEGHKWILQRPISLALLVFLIATLPLLHDAPNSAIALANLVGVIPVLRLLKPRLTNTFQQMLIALIASVLLWHLIKFPQFPIWVKRDLMAVLSLVAVGLFIWLLTRAQRQQAVPTPTLVGISLGVFLLFIAFLANLSGYVGLSDLLARGTLGGAYRAVVLYTVVIVGTVAISFALLAKPTQQPPGLGIDRDRLARRLKFALSVVVLLLWVHSTLSLFAIRENVYAAISAALNYEIKIGSASFSVSNVVAFVLTLLVGYLIASVTRAILSEGVLPRLKLAYGLPNAIATVTHYVLLVLIFLFALVAAGVELSKFTILTGAVGVGLGFGLQNVVNNFVSGLILLFERPVRVGDILEVKGIGGEVTKIGFRSSTVHAFDGSDLIIPNATLISEQVTNWTLTGTRRQIILQFHVAYENDPTNVRDLLRDTTASHPGVLDHPVPTALFLGFGDSALNFEVRFWAARPDVVPELRSDVALSIARALRESGITLAIPQRTLRITRSDQSESLAEALNNEDAIVGLNKDGGSAAPGKFAVKKEPS